MYILGHWTMTERSGCVSREEMLAHMALLLLPDIARCHEVGYSELFGGAAGSAAETVEARIYRSHLLGDWFVHFGAIRDQIKQGWAYRQMRPFARRYRDFFADAQRLGLRTAGPIRDSPRGFSHTMAEYAIDTHLAIAARSSLCLDDLRRSVADISLERVCAHLRALGVSAYSADLANDVENYLARIRRSRNMGELAFRAGVAKFGLIDCEDSVHYVRDFILAGMEELPDRNIEDVVDRGADFIRVNS